MSQNQNTQMSNSTNAKPTRRKFLKGVTVGTVGVALGSNYAVNDVSALPISGGVAVGQAANYLMRKAKEFVTGTSVDTQKYNQLSAEQAHVDAKADLLEMASANETVLTTMNNLLANSENAAFADGKYAAVEAMNLGKSKADTKAAAKTPIDEFFTVQTKNLLDHFSVQTQSYLNIINSLNDNPNTGWNSVIRHPESGNNDKSDFGGKASITQDSKSLQNGNSHTFDYIEWNFTDGGYDETTRIWIRDTANTIYVKPLPTNTNGTKEEIHDGKDWQNLLNEINTKHSNVISEINTWIDGVYPNYTSGDIALTEIASASMLADKAPNEEGFSYAGADLALMGLSGGEHNYKIELIGDDKTVRGTIYAKNRSNPLELNTVYSPSVIAGTVWLAYETTDSDGNTVSDLVALTQNFKIVSGVDKNGNEVSEVTFTENNQQTTNTDVQEIQKELQRLQDLQDKIETQQKQAIEEDNTSSGGGGAALTDNFLFENYYGIPVWAYGAAGTLVAYLFGGSE